MSHDLSDYIEVPARIAIFKDRYPEGSLTGEYEVREIHDELLIVYTAKAYRHEKDRHPGVGTASEPYPGRTPFTKGSEIMNAETSAWGRALVALGIVGSRKIASAQEVRAAQANQTEKPAALPDEKVDALVAAIKDAALGYDRLCLSMGAVGADAPKVKRKDSIRKALSALTPQQADQLLSNIKAQNGTVKDGE